MPTAQQLSQLHSYVSGLSTDKLHTLIKEDEALLATEASTVEDISNGRKPYVVRGWQQPKLVSISSSGALQLQVKEDHVAQLEAFVQAYKDELIARGATPRASYHSLVQTSF